MKKPQAAKPKAAAPTERTVPKQLTPWAPGQSGNPAGRPKGTRNKLGEAFIEALHADFAEHGVATIAKVREEDPVAYVRVCAGILPKELRITDERELTDDELVARIKQLDAIIRPFLGIEGNGEAGGGSKAPARH